MTDVYAANDGPGAKQQVVAYTEKSQDKHESRHIQLVREYGFHPRSKVQVEDGALLPKKFEPFPQNMYGRPLEEIDNFIYEETFCVVSKRFRKNYIHRFTGTKSLFWFTPWSSTRRACVYLATNQYFDYFVMATILFNCIFLAMSETVEEAEYIFLAIYTAEMIIKIIAKGFVLNKYTYLRNPWNWLDFVVITSGYATIALDVGNLAGLRTFRVLRALKTVSIMPGLKTIINALLHSFKQLAEVMTLTIFCLMVFALFALQVYMGELRNKCVRNLPDGWNVTDDEWKTWINDTENWIYDVEGLPMLCGNLTGARHCPPGHTCLCIGENPNHGYTNFDNFMWSMLTTFQLITLDYWENVYNMVLATCGPMSVSFFTVVVFFGSFYLINLMLAVVALSYEEEAEITQEERRKDLIDHRDDSTFSFDPAAVNVKQLSKEQRKKLDSKKGVLLTYNSKKKSRRRKKSKDGENGKNNDESKSRSVTPSPSPSPRHSLSDRPQALALQRTKGLLAPQPPGVLNPNTPNTLHPLGLNYRGQLLPSSRQASSNASEGGGVNRESSLDDSGVVDDHDDQDAGVEIIHAAAVGLQREITPVTLALSPREIRIIKCNGNIAKIKNHNVYSLHPEYLSQIVVLDDLPDRNCDRCVNCCIDYESWLQFQNCLYKIVKDPLFELGITLCIVLNTMFLALEHHGMSESVRSALDIGNKVFTSVFTFECILKVMALSKDFFLCGWNIFDLIIVSASLLDLIFELVDGLSVLRGLRLLRVLKLAQSWTTMKVLLSIIISTIGALGNLTFVLVIVIYIFAVIGMQLFSKDYTPDKFYPDPVPRWNFNDFFHSFMMIFRILCGEWIEPLWDCMRAEEKEGASSCFAIFLPALVMGNFMVLNLFLALLLNSFNSEELKSKKEEVGEDSKLARSFERIRSIVRKKRMTNKEKNENEANTKLEQLVNEIVIKQRNEKKRYLTAELHIPCGTGPLYSQSYQESLNRPLSGSDFCYEIPLKDRNPLHTISGSQETFKGMDDRQLLDDNRLDKAQQILDVNERKLLQHQLSSGFGTQHSKDETTTNSNNNNNESIELIQIGHLNSLDNNNANMQTTSTTTATTALDHNNQLINGSAPGIVMMNKPSSSMMMMTATSGAPTTDPNKLYDEAYLQYQKSLINRSPSYRKSIDKISLISQTSSGNNSTISNKYHTIHPHQIHEQLSSPKNLLISSRSINNNNNNNNSCINYDRDKLINAIIVNNQKMNNKKITTPSSTTTSSPTAAAVLAGMASASATANLNNKIKRLLSDQSINTLSCEQDEMLNQMNLKDELLNCEQKELFQFLNDDFDNSNNYFSETIGYGNAINLIDPDTDSLLNSAGGANGGGGGGGGAVGGTGSIKSGIQSIRKISNGSLKSNISSISNSIFQTLEHCRGGSINGSLDKIYLNNASMISNTSSGVCGSGPTDRELLNALGGGGGSGGNNSKRSDFDDIIHNFDTELKSLKSLSFDRQTTIETGVSPKLIERRNYAKSSSNIISNNDNNDNVVLRKTKSSNNSNNNNNYNNYINNENNNSNNNYEFDLTKRRSLEKHNFNSLNNDDIDLSVGIEIKNICDQLQSSYNNINNNNENYSNNVSNNNNIIPVNYRRKNDFQSSFDRIKRLSLIERVEELNEDQQHLHQHSQQSQQPLRIESERLPRKNLSKDKLETLSLKSNLSDEIFRPASRTVSIREFQQNISRDTIDKQLDLQLDLQVKATPPPPPPKPPKKVTMKERDESDRSEGFNKRTPPRMKSPKKGKVREGPTRPWHCLVSYVDDLTVGGRRNSQGIYDDPMSFPSFGNNRELKIPQDCFPQKCYEECKCWDTCIQSHFGQKWMRVRTNVLHVVDTPAFEWFVLVLIFASSITLCFEDIHLDKNKTLKRILYWTNFAFCLIFVIEMVLKWIAFGFTRYFSSFWTILDFIIVFVSVFSLLIEENENLKVLRSLRTLRALRPLRAISRWQGMRIVVNALMYAIPSIFNVLLVCLVFWLIFSIMGVQFFGGKFFKCVDDEGELLPTTIVNDKWQCYAQNYSWINSKITFDHVGMGYLALFQVATFEGWMEVMADAVDARGVDLQPQREANLYAYIYFVIFIVCGSFFTLNLFIGVIIDNFNMLKKKYEGGVLEMFLTESQKHYYTAMKKLGRKKPQKVIKRPMNQVLAMFYDLSNSRRFEIAIFVLIFLNMLTMGIEHYNQPHAVFFVLEVSNAFFTTVFSLEAIVKIVGLRYHYFTVPWNVFDFLLVLASILGILMEDIMIDLPVSPTLLRVVRVFRIGRILRLIKAAKGIRKLLFALVVSLPALFNIGALLALITFIYAIIGMSLFGHVRQQGALDDMVNFETFGRSMQLLFRLMTSAGWNDVLESLMIQPPHCELEMDTNSNGDCGHPLLAITYFTSFIIISYMIVINMYIAIILENFNQAHQEEEIGIVEDDLEMFYIRWSKYDPHAGQFIPFNQLSDFIASLDPPLGIAKPNTVALVSFNLPISKGNKIHCLDILHALVKHVLGHVEETDNFKQLQDQMDVKFKKQFPTRKELEIISSTRIWKREEKAAKLIQTTWREYVRMKKERERSPLSQEDENTQTSSPGGWQSKLAALNFLHLQVHRRGTGTSSRGSSRKSSRASDASDLSELAGPWLNLPMMLVSSTSDGKDVKNGDCERLDVDFKKPTERRRSFYNFPFFLRHQDAMDDAMTSPSAAKRKMKSSETALSLHTAAEKPSVSTTTTAVQTITPKSKRATSFVRKKPPLERGFSAQSALRLNRNACLTDDSLMSTTDVSILVTEPSPEVPTAPTNRMHSEATLVHVLVHRESEEYQSEVDEVTGNKTYKQVPKNANYPILSSLEAHPLVTITVESPQDPPNLDFSGKPARKQTAEVSLMGDSTDSIINVDEPIDVNLPRDVSNIFYDYEEPAGESSPVSSSFSVDSGDMLNRATEPKNGSNKDDPNAIS